MITQFQIEPLAAKISFDQHAELVRQKYNPDLHRHEAHIHMGKKYARVDVGDSGKYMVDLETGDIYGIKAYGVIHRGHHYGTLDTINNYYWGGYVARLKEAA